MFRYYKHIMAQTLVAGIFASIMIAPSTTYADSAAPAVLGKTIGEWSAKWWQWALAAPASSNPMIDNTGTNCNVSQRGSVWFLAGVWNGGTVERNCTIPEGKYIFFPIVNNFWLNSAFDDVNNTEADYRRLATLSPTLGSDIEATLNGTPIIFNPKTPIIRTQSPVFTANFPADHIFSEFGIDAGSITGYPVVSDGFWIMLPPLPQGNHILHFRAGEFQNVTYHLTVD